MSDAAAETRAKILLIDDDELIAGSLQRYLRDQGCEVDLATEPELAAKLLATREYDTVMVDPYMTAGLQQNRLSLIATIREMQPHAGVIIVTAYGTDALESGVCRGTMLMLKPSAVADLGRAAMSRLSDSSHPPRRDSGDRPGFTMQTPQRGPVQ